MNELKRCKMCGEEFPATTEYFYVNKRAKDGLHYQCKECSREIAKKNYSKSALEKSDVLIDHKQNDEIDDTTSDNEPINIENRDGILVTSSRDVAERFGKRHDHVLRDIETFKKDVPNFGEMFNQAIGFDSYKREQKQYLLTRDGFSLLAMGFTGAKALKWKIKYIEAFNKMEEALRKQLAPTGKQLMAMALLEAKETMDKQVLLIDSLQQKITEDAPKVSFVKILQKCENASSIEDFAKTLCNEGFEIGRNRMFKWLKNKKILQKNNTPYQQYIINGAFQVKKTVHLEDGIYKQYTMPLITPKGQLYLFKKMQQDPNLGLVG